MRNKNLIVLISIWLIIVLFDYYLFPYFIKPIIWILTVIVLIIFIIKQIIKTIKEYPKDLKKRVFTFLTSGILFTLTFYNFYKIELLKKWIGWSYTIKEIKLLIM